MNWPIFAILAFVFLVLERGLASLLGVGGVYPSFVLILLVYVGMFAPPLTLAWAAIVLGLLIDVTTPYPFGNPIEDTMILGPHALGFLAGAYALTQLRTMIFRGSPITMTLVVFLIGLFVSLVTVAMLRMRGIVVADAIVNYSAMSDLVFRFQQLIYTAIVALPVGYALNRVNPLLAFHSSKR